MSFYTSLTGLNAATAQLGVTSNNIANVSTVGFKRSRTDFGDIFATSPLQKASATIGQGVSLKRVTQEFGQGNMMFSSNTLDLAISGDGFFPLKSQDGLQDMFTRNGAFLMNDQFNVVNSAGQRLMAAKVDSSGKADLGDMNILTIPQKTSKMAKQTSKIQLGLNFPADASVITKDFNKNDSTTFNKSTALTIYDEGGNSYLATIYYAKTQNASETSQSNKWQTYVYVGENLIGAALQQATTSTGDVLYVNKYGQLKAKSEFVTPAAVAELNSSFSKKTLKFSLDELTDIKTSVPATVGTGVTENLGTGAADGVDFSVYKKQSKTDLLQNEKQNSYIKFANADIQGAIAGNSSLQFTLNNQKSISIIASNKTVGVTVKDITNQLNADKDFSTLYVAQSKKSVTIPAIPINADPTVPGATDFKSLRITIDGIDHTIDNLKSNAPYTLDELAKQIEKRLQVLDRGFEYFKVTATPAGDSPTDLTIVDSMGRNLNNISLILGTTNAVYSSTDPTANQIFATVDPLAPNGTDGDLTVTSIARYISIDGNGDPVAPPLNRGLDISNALVLNAVGGASPALITNTQTDGVQVDDPDTLSSKSADDLKDLFSLNVDNSNQSVSVGLEYLAGKTIKLSGKELATELTNSINRKYGDEKPFNFSKIQGTTFSLQLKSSDINFQPTAFKIELSNSGDMYYEDLVREVQAQIDTNPDAWEMRKGIMERRATVSYDTNQQELVFTTLGSNKVTLIDPLGTKNQTTQGINDEALRMRIVPDSATAPNLLPTNDQRYGSKVEFDPVKSRFVFKSGTTGDKSSLKISNIRVNTLATQTSKGLGLTGDAAAYLTDISKVDAVRGIKSDPAVLIGKKMGINVDNNFSVDLTNNQFVVSVNGITGTVIVPPKDTYTLDTFIAELQSGINNIQSVSSNGLSAETVDGVKVSYDRISSALKFTTSTASTDSYIKVEGATRWGLNNLDAKFGTTSTWIKPAQFKNPDGSPVYIDGFGQESANASGFEALPAWSPVYFDKGELTFDTGGNLISPKLGAQLETVFLPSGKGKLNMTVDYSKSTQYATPYAVLSQAQDGAPEGDLVGVAIADDGLVKASYSNGAQISLAKIVLVNFSNASGLRQIGDTTYFKTSDSGAPKYGEAGSAGFGTVRSGATERANVDLTQELVDLITEQRNFQANAKAMETSTSMTQTIIQIRA